MTSNSEDKIFKNIKSEDLGILLEMIDTDNVKVRNLSKEMLLYNSNDDMPNIVLELDFENLIIVPQTTPVDDNFSKKALVYVAVGNRVKDNDKPINLVVLSTAEESKVVTFEFTKGGVFSYRVINLKDRDADKIIKLLK